eukprot:SAG31_NODE_2024_length_6644_cov_7.943621_11_plen_197_part_00
MIRTSRSKFRILARILLEYSKSTAVSAYLSTIRVGGYRVDGYSCTTNLTGTVQATWDTAEMQCATTYPECHNCFPTCESYNSNCDPTNHVVNGVAHGVCGTCLPGTKYGTAQMAFQPGTSTPANCSARVFLSYKKKQNKTKQTKQKNFELSTEPTTIRAKRARLLGYIRLRRVLRPRVRVLRRSELRAFRRGRSAR